MINPTISAVIPCFNEEKSLPQTIARIRPHVDEIIVVDNGSTDNSAAVAQQNGAVVVCDARKDHGIGYGFALMSGLKAATGYYIITIDADGEHQIEKIPEIIKHMESANLDFVSCSRVSTQSKSIITRIRRLGVLILSTQVRVLFKYKMEDVLSGMWVMRYHVPARLNLTQGGWNLSPEIKLSAISNPLVNFGEYPILATVRSHGKSKQILWKTALEHASFILNYWFYVSLNRLGTLTSMFVSRYISQKLKLQTAK